VTQPASPAPDPSGRPTFIIGCARSGTTLLRMMLDSHPHISAGAETKFLPDMDRMVKRWNVAEKFGFSQDDVVRRMRDFYGSIQADYMRSRGKVRWVEKSPVYTLHLDLIEQMYPDAQYIHLVRDARDVVASTKDRWGWRAALGTALRKWRLYVITARAFGAKVGPERYHELRYEDLVAEPEAKMRAVLEFLGEPWDLAVLEYNSADQGFDDFHLSLQKRRRAQSGDKALIYRSRARGGKGLNPLLRLATWVGSRSVMREFGY
jgi:hypothetical protein